MELEIFSDEHPIEYKNCNLQNQLINKVFK